ncbi:MAG: hypothetical protein Q7J54_00320 [Candidatus Woesearchaeota archaeon]|nr:hypothetical protein [Candidatus Woesearchaeota archaeon]
MQENSRQKLPTNVAGLDTEHSKISQVVAVSDALKDYENERVTFSFEPYNSNQCRLGKLDNTEAKKLTRELKKISLTMTKHFRHQNASSIACKPVHNSGNYSVLFVDIPEDAELLEVDYSGTGRIFGFMVESIFNVVAVGKEHR